MTKQEQELLDWALAVYFSQWEIDEALKILEHGNMDDAVEHLRELSAASFRDRHGPGDSVIHTRPPKVQLWRAGSRKYVNGPDIEIAIVKLCRMKLQSLYQEKLL